MTERRLVVPGLVVLVALLATLAPGCSRLFGDSLSSACSAARQEFNDYLDLQTQSDNAFSDADAHWTDIYNASINGELSEDALNLGVVALNDDLARAQRKATRAATARARYETARDACDVASMPDACRQEFRQYRAVLDHADQVLAAQVQLTAAVTAQRDAIEAQDVDAANAATDRHEAAQSSINALVDDYNANILPAYERALDACDAAI